jgi:hypothetical protein
VATGCGGTSSRPSWASKKGEWRQTTLKGSTKHGNGRLAGRLPAHPRRGPAHRPQQCQAAGAGEAVLNAATAALRSMGARAPSSLNTSRPKTGEGGPKNRAPGRRPQLAASAPTKHTSVIGNPTPHAKVGIVYSFPIAAWCADICHFVGNSQQNQLSFCAVRAADHDFPLRFFCAIVFSSFISAWQFFHCQCCGQKQTFGKMTSAKKKDRLCGGLSETHQCLDQAERLAFSTSRWPAIASSTATLACSIDAIA